MRVNIITFSADRIIIQTPRLKHVRIHIQTFELRSRTRVKLSGCQLLAIAFGVIGKQVVDEGEG